MWLNWREEQPSVTGRAAEWDMKSSRVWVEEKPSVTCREAECDRKSSWLWSIALNGHLSNPWYCRAIIQLTTVSQWPGVTPLKIFMLIEQNCLLNGLPGNISSPVKLWQVFCNILMVQKTIILTEFSGNRLYFLVSQINR